MGFCPFFFRGKDIKIMLNQRSDKVELLRIAEAVALEKSIDKEIILTSMEAAIQKAAKTKFGSENDIRAKIDRESGDITLHKVLTIVEKPENLDTEISLKNAIKVENKEGIKVGDEIFEELPPVDFGRKPGSNGSFSWEKTDKTGIFKK